MSGPAGGADPHDVRIRFFHNDGTAYGNDFQVNAATPSGNEQGAVVAMVRPAVAGGGAHPPDAVVVWQLDTDVLAARPSATSGASFFETPFSVTTLPAGVVAQPAVSAVANGKFNITWSDGTSIYIRQYDGAGATSAAAEKIVSSNGGIGTTRSAPDIATFGDGSAVVVWRSVDGTSNVATINGVVVSATGTIVKAEFTLASLTPSQFTVNVLDAPSVVADASGGFVVAWTGFDFNDAAAGDPPSGTGIAVATYYSDYSGGISYLMNDILQGAQFGGRIRGNGSNACGVWGSVQSGSAEVFFKRYVLSLL